MEAVAEIVSGESTRGDVLTKIGEPNYAYINERWWVFEGIRHSAGFGLIGVAGGSGAAGAGYEDRRESEVLYLLFEFDAAGRVIRKLEVNASEPCTPDRDVCFQRGSLLAAYTPDWDKASRPGECVLYLIPLYASGEPDRSWEISEESGAYVGYIGRGKFTGMVARSILASGLHSLVARSDGVGPELSLRTTFGCEAGDVVYLTATNTTSTQAELNLVSESVARTALSGRLINFVAEISE